jgi:hypothetical protein
MILTVQSIPLGNPDDQDGALVLDGDRLVAVLCRLSAGHGDLAGQWFLECSFGVGALDETTYDTSDQACASITRAMLARETQTIGADARKPRGPRTS